MLYALSALESANDHYDEILWAVLPVTAENLTKLRSWLASFEAVMKIVPEVDCLTVDLWAKDCNRRIEWAAVDESLDSLIAPRSENYDDYTTFEDIRVNGNVSWVFVQDDLAVERLIRDKSEALDIQLRMGFAGVPGEPWVALSAHCDGSRIESCYMTKRHLKWFEQKIEIYREIHAED